MHAYPVTESSRIPKIWSDIHEASTPYVRSRMVPLRLPNGYTVLWIVASTAPKDSRAETNTCSTRGESMRDFYESVA